MPIRPAMHTRDASGRQVSLLNDEPASKASSAAITSTTTAAAHTATTTLTRPGYASFDVPQMRRTESYFSSTSSSPRTPDLLRANSYDSQTSNGPMSPSTPDAGLEYGRAVAYTSAYPDPSLYDQRQSVYGTSYVEKPYTSEPIMRPQYLERAPSSYEEEVLPESTSPERNGTSKRYPCRFKDSHGCDKTFTTSGHASRHSKIHTAEKAVHCSFLGCHKKFTRADNMKQHLETHYKERSRASSSKTPTTATKLTVAAGVKKTNRPSSRASHARPGVMQYDSYSQYQSPQQSVYSPGASPASDHAALDMASFQHSLPTQPVSPTHARTNSDAYRLEALAAICTDRQ